MSAPVPCRHCGDVTPRVKAISVIYDTTRWQGLHAMFRVECPCGAIGKCRPDPQAARESWNEPWQAKVTKDRPTAALHEGGR